MKLYNLNTSIFMGVADIIFVLCKSEKNTQLLNSQVTFTRKMKAAYMRRPIHFSLFNWCSKSIRLWSYNIWKSIFGFFSLFCWNYVFSRFFFSNILYAHILFILYKRLSKTNCSDFYLTTLMLFISDVLLLFFIVNIGTPLINLFFAENFFL